MLQERLTHPLRKQRISSQELTSLGIDIYHHLEQTGLFKKIRMKKTADLQSMLEFRCTIGDPAQEPQQIAKILEAMWHEVPLGYGQVEDAYEVQVRENRTEFHFLTFLKDNIVVTGRMIISGFSDEE